VVTAGKEQEAKAEEGSLRERCTHVFRPATFSQLRSYSKMNDLEKYVIGMQSESKRNARRD
jgi:hypothetical protein